MSGFSANVKVNFSPKGVQDRFASKAHRAQFLLDQQVAKDSNYYCPRDVGSLQDSVIPSAASGSGLLIWDEPYARKQYYDYPNKSKDQNPNASMKWFEKSKKVCKSKWLKLVQNGFN